MRILKLIRITLSALLFASQFAAATDAPSKTIVIPAGRDVEYDKYHYAPAVRVGETVILSGIPAGGPGTYQEQIRRMFQRVEKALNAAGASMADIVELQTNHVIAKSIDGFREEIEEFLAVNAECIPSGFPA